MYYYVVIEELPTDYQNEVTTVICRKIRPGHEKDTTIGLGVI
jgi:hypothetical protein